MQKEIFLSVIQNLLVNALDHAGTKKRQLIIDIDFEIQDDDSFIMRFKDNGKGISKKKLNNLFDYSNREHAKGFGMMIIKKGVEFHGGEIDVISEPSKGMEYVIRFNSTYVKQ